MGAWPRDPAKRQPGNPATRQPRDTIPIPMITNERDDAGLWYAIACGALLVFAAAIRFRSLGATLFEDEVWVAELVRRGGWHAHSWSTPPLFYAICRGWISLRGVSNAA